MQIKDNTDGTFSSKNNFIIKYRQGNKNGKPDSLSRRPDYIKNNIEENITKETEEIYSKNKHPFIIFDL